jgi:hypothetical protein
MPGTEPRTPTQRKEHKAKVRAKRKRKREREELKAQQELEKESSPYPWKVEHDPLKTAGLVLIYKELFGACLFSADEVMAYCEKEETRELLSPLVKYGASQLYDADWFVLHLFNDAPDEVAHWAGQIAKSDPVRAEVLLHFWPDDSKPPFGANWTEPYIGRRWDEVENAMIFLEARGLATSSDAVYRVALDAQSGTNGNAPLAEESAKA